jgi:holo-[acyl-carrier protein] synthase
MIGTDIVFLPRLSPEKDFVKRILTEEEYFLYEAFQTEKKRRDFLGGRFAAKEAIYKATQDPHFLSYTVLPDEKGRPYVKGHPEIEISIAHDGEYAVAMISIKEG